MLSYPLAVLLILCVICGIRSTIRHVRDHWTIWALARDAERERRTSAELRIKQENLANQIYLILCDFRRLTGTEALFSLDAPSCGKNGGIEVCVEDRSKKARLIVIEINLFRAWEKPMTVILADKEFYFPKKPDEISKILSEKRVFSKAS